MFSIKPLIRVAILVEKFNSIYSLLVLASLLTSDDDFTHRFEFFSTETCVVVLLTV